MKYLPLLFLLLFSLSLSAQPWLQAMDVPENPKPVLGLFKTERQAGAWLTVGGFTAMAAGSWIQGRAAWSIQMNGHSRTFDSYGMTRFTGLSLQLTGAAAYGAGFAYRSKKWYKKRPLLWAGVEAIGLFGLNCLTSQYAYRKRKRI